MTIIIIWCPRNVKAFDKHNIELLKYAAVIAIGCTQ